MTLERRRCLVAARSIVLGGGAPLRRRDGSALLLAGVYERNRNLRSESLSFALLIDQGEPGVRLPLLVGRENVPLWVSSRPFPELPDNLWDRKVVLGTD